MPTLFPEEENPYPNLSPGDRVAFFVDDTEFQGAIHDFLEPRSKGIIVRICGK